MFTWVILLSKWTFDVSFCDVSPWHIQKREKSKYDLLVLRDCLMENDTLSWIVHWGITNNAYSSQNWLVQVLN